MKYFFYLFFLSPFFVAQIEGKYERHNQSCGGLNGTDVKWSLEIKKGNTYSFQITSRTNDYLSKPKSTFILGTWSMTEDTLTLYQWGKNENALVFSLDGDKLVYHGDKSPIINKDLIYLDYLKKPKD